jgi:hypothetical protein
MGRGVLTRRRRPKETKMNPCATIALAAIAGLAAPAMAQETVVVSYSWSEVIAGTLTPVSSPNSILEPGEGARIGINVYQTINGTNAVGETTTYTPPPPPGVGTNAGTGAMLYSLHGTGGDATGSWFGRAVNPSFAYLISTGTILDSGATIDNFGGNQFVAPGGTANSSNPLVDGFRGVWSPASYTPRTINFKASDGHGASNPYTGILVIYNWTELEQPPWVYPDFLTKYVDASYGDGVNIPIAPAPATLTLLIPFVPRRPSRRRH